MLVPTYKLRPQQPVDKRFVHLTRY